MAVGMTVSVGLLIGAAQASTAPMTCTTTRGAFVPTRAAIAHVGRVRVISVGMNRDGTMGTPPLTNTGKHELAWYDRSAKPGSGRGGVATDAHTWPDGSALGNQMLSNLHKGDTVVLADGHGRQVCYRIVSRTQYPRSRVPMNAIVNGSGKGQTLSMVVCSGRRLGPGNWTDRTVWVARVVHTAPPAPTPTPTPTPSPSPSGGLLGGLGGLL